MRMLDWLGPSCGTIVAAALLVSPLPAAAQLFQCQARIADQTQVNTISFESLISGGDETLEVSWDFGDGNTSTEEASLVVSTHFTVAAPRA